MRGASYRAGCNITMESQMHGLIHTVQYRQTDIMHRQTESQPRQMFNTVDLFLGKDREGMALTSSASCAAYTMEVCVVEGRRVIVHHPATRRNVHTSCQCIRTNKNLHMGHAWQPLGTQ